MKVYRCTIITVLLFLSVNFCYGKNIGEIVAKNGIYAMIDIYPKDNWPISMIMFFEEADTIRISREGIDEAIKSIVKEGEYVSLGLSDTRHAIADLFNCTPQQALDANRKLNDDLDMTKFGRELIKVGSFEIGIRYARLQAFFLRTTMGKFNSDPVTSEGIPLDEVPKNYLVLLSIANIEKPDKINIVIEKTN